MSSVVFAVPNENGRSAAAFGMTTSPARDLKDSDRYVEINPEGEELRKAKNPFGATYAEEDGSRGGTFGIMSMSAKPTMEVSTKLLSLTEEREVRVDVDHVYGTDLNDLEWTLEGWNLKSRSPIITK